MQLDLDRTGLQALVAAIRPDKFRFLVAERHRAYAAILWKLLEHRRVHEIEVYYDDLMIEALRVVPEVEPGLYSPDAFRSDVKQLTDWGNLAPPRLEPKRIETLADRALQKFLYRLDDETAAILEFIESRPRAAAAALSDRGRHLLRDAAERLSEALRLARQITRRKSPAEPVEGNDLLRLAYLCLEVDRKVDDAARELAAFDAALIGFAISPFRLEALGDIIDRLERYVEDYVTEATARARALHRSARTLLRPPLSDVIALSRDHVERRLREDPLLSAPPGSVPAAREVVERIVPFFAPGGRFEVLLERVHGSARDVVRRVHRHVENVRARNIRIETLRDRTREMAGLVAGDIPAANAWINALFASAHMVTDLRSGTPAQRSPLPRPARRYESRRAAHRGGYLADKSGRPGQARALERLRFLVLGRFVDEKILRGKESAHLNSAVLDAVEDFRTLIEAVKVHDLRGGRSRNQLSYRIPKEARQAPDRARARFETSEGSLDAPNVVFTSAKSGGLRG
jgi:hypothetical protein